MDSSAHAKLQRKNSQLATASGTSSEQNRLKTDFDTLNEITHDILGHRPAPTDEAVHITNFKYDGLGCTVMVKDSSIKSTVEFFSNYTYDDAPHTLTKADRKDQVTKYAYDTLNHLTLVQNADEKTNNE